MVLTETQVNILRNLDSNELKNIISEAKDRLLSIESADQIITSKANNHFQICIVVLTGTIAFICTGNYKNDLLNLTILFSSFIIASTVYSFLSIKEYKYNLLGFSPKMLISEAIFYSNDKKLNERQYLCSLIDNIQESIDINHSIQQIRSNRYRTSQIIFFIGIFISIIYLLIILCFNN